MNEMIDQDWRDRIVIDPAIHHGDPCIRGTRVPVSVLVASLAEGDSIEQLLQSFPQLTHEDIQAAVRWSAKKPTRAKHGDL